MKMMSLFCVIAVLSCSCLARGGISGELAVHIETDVMTLHKAVVQTLSEEKISIKKESADNMSSLVEAVYADSTPVTIHSRLLTSELSSMTIQIGMFGDAMRSNALLNEIARRLPRDAQAIKADKLDSTQP